MGDITARLMHHPVFCAAGTGACEALPADAMLLVRPPGTVLSRAGEASTRIVVLLDGAVRFYHHGDSRLIAFAKGPATIGDVEALSNNSFLYDVRALTEVELVTMRAETYDALLRAHPAALRAQVREQSQIALGWASNQGHLLRPIEERLALLLLTLDDLAGKGTPYGDRPIDCPARQEFLATALGVARRSIATPLARWKRKGIYVKRAGRYVLRQRAFLESMVGPLRGSLCLNGTRATLDPEQR